MRDAGPEPVHSGFFCYPDPAEIPFLSTIRFKALLEWIILILVTQIGKSAKMFNF
jgi:hypothetical protein